MQVSVEIDENCLEPKVTITVAAINEEVNKLIHKLTQQQQSLIAGFREGTVKLFEQAQIIRFYTAAQKVYFQTDTGEFLSKQRLYEIENSINQDLFVRISHSEIVNLKAIQMLDLSFSGTIGMHLTGGSTTYVSRRYVAQLKKLLNL